MSLLIQESMAQPYPEVIANLLTQAQGPLQKLIEESSELVSLSDQNDPTLDESKQIRLESSRQVADIIEQLLEVTRERLKRENKIQPVLIQLYQNHERIRSIFTEPLEVERIAKPDLELLMGFEQIVLRDLKKFKIKIAFIAAELAISERQLHRNIKALLSITPNQYVKILKVNEARQHLEAYAFKTLSEVAYAVGFNDPYYFSKVYEQHFGQKPMSYLS